MDELEFELGALEQEDEEFEDSQQQLPLRPAHKSQPYQQ